jgi:diguanylate cyclase (GGDEF)-like protein/PAS domain S-box-containing protein
MKDIEQSALNRGRQRFARMVDHIRAILDTVREPFVVLDGRFRIRLSNKSFCKTFHVSPKEINGKSIDALGDGAWKTPALRTWLGTAIDQRSDIPDFEMEGHFPTIGLRTVLFHARRVEIRGASRRIILLTVDDITQRKQAEGARKRIYKSLKSASMTDVLTGLYNRRGYSALSQHYLDLARRRHKKIFVIFADLDGLKKINDRWGHPAGDQSLIRAADILRKTFRKSDVIARIGGDEFAIATMENGHASVASQIARLRKNLMRHAIQKTYERPLSMSVGVAVSNDRKTTSIEELTSQADALMYVEKRAKHGTPMAPSMETIEEAEEPLSLEAGEDQLVTREPMASVAL